jgi:quinol monooxygenase YgiN
MIVISGAMQFHPDDRTPFLEAFGPIQAATRAEEPGCLQYAFSADPLDDTSVLIYEHWQDGAALEAHFRHPNFGKAVQVIGGFRRTGGNMQKYHVDKAAPIVGADGKPTASFD